METTTIAITKNIRDELKEFGNKGETFSCILQKLIDSAKQRQLQDLLMSEEKCIPIETALDNARKKWQK
jgi:predicted CopG family antitoxin